MKFQNFVRLLRTRWMIVCVTIAVGVLGAVAVNLLTTPLYRASTTLFVSTTAAGASPSEVYNGDLFSEQRVKSYVKLLAGEAMAQRTVDKLHLPLSADQLREKIKASSAPDTVLIDVSVLDPSPNQARDIANALSDGFVVMVSELETPAEGGTPDARVVVQQHASLPTHSVIPRTKINLVLGLALGVLLGIGLALLRDRFDNTVKNRQILEEITDAGLVATIPFDKARRKEAAISFASDRSTIAESFRMLRTNLKFLEVDDPPRVIVITSSRPGEGKTITALNTALALAEAEHNVVLVDGDMRRPKVGAYLDLIGSAGLSSALTGQASLKEVLQKTRFPGLSVLTSGPIPPNPSELLGTKAAQKVLSELRAGFDYVIVDSSPVLSVTDAAILAAASDGVLVLARFADTKQGQLAHAIEDLTNVGARILGAIFTMMPAGGDEYRYYYHDGEADRVKHHADDGRLSSSPATSVSRQRGGPRIP